MQSRRLPCRATSPVGAQRMPPWCCPRLGWFWRPPCAGWHAAYLRSERVRSAGYAPASQHWQCRVVASGPWPQKGERSARPGQIPMPRRSLVKLVRSRRQPATHQVAAIRRTAIHNKERTPLRALVLVPAGISRRMFRCFRHTSPATLYLYFHIESSLSLL